MSTLLQSLAPDLWTLHHREFSVAGLRIGTRTNIVKLPDGSILLHAPGPLEEGDLHTIRALGAVSHIVAPNLMHHLSLVSVAAAFPEARVLATAGLTKKQPELRIDDTLGDHVPASLAGVFDIAPLDGCPALNEHELFHIPSRTLLATDLAFNLKGATGFTRFAMWINNANDRCCVTRLARAQYIQDAKAAARSVNRMADAWEFDRVLLSHGEVIESGGKEALRQAWSF